MPLVPINAPPHPDELRRGDLKEQTPCTARAVLTTPFGVDAHQMVSAYIVDDSPSQSRWTSREPPASSRNASGTADATGPGECASHNGPYHEAAVRQETGWDQSLRDGETPNCFSGEVSDTTPAFTHATTCTAAFDATKEYCTRNIVFFWQLPSYFCKWTPSRFTVNCISCSCGEQFFAAEKIHLFGDHQTLQHTMCVSDPCLHKKYEGKIRNFDLAVWEREREHIVLVGSYAKFAQNPVMQSHLLDTGDRLLAEASTYDLVWGIGYKADHVSARQPPL